MKKLSRALLGIVILLMLVAMLAPWKAWVEKGVKGALLAQGIKDVSFTVDSLALDGLVFKDVSFGGKLPFTLDRLTVSFSLADLLERRIRQIDADDLTATYDAITARVQDVSLRFVPAQNGWQGEWNIRALDMDKLPLALPSLAGVGTFRMQGTVLDIDGKFKSADGTHAANFALDYDTGAPEQAVLKIHSAALPWSGGNISTQHATIPLGGDRKASVVLRVDKVPLGRLLSDVTSGRADATGVVSGTLPLVINSDGTVMFRAGSLKAPEAGTITLAPDAIPGDNDQIVLLREVLGNFHYRQLSLGIDSGEHDKLSMLLQLSGNNPEVYNGREIKLNVRLTGDVLSLMQQTVMPMNDPKQWLKQEEK